MSIDNEAFLKLYKPAKAATQSGLGNTKFWYLRIEPCSYYYVEPFIGWIGSKNTEKQILLKFDSLEKALFYVRKYKKRYIFEKPKYLKRLPKSYVSNFMLK